MQRVGDDAAGFSVDRPLTGGVLVTGWGFWSQHVAKAFAAGVAAGCRGQKSPSLMLDLRELKPMREEGQLAFSELLRSLESLGVPRVSIVTTNPLTKLQLVRLAATSGAEQRIDWISATNSMSRDA